VNIQLARALVPAQWPHNRHSHIVGGIRACKYLFDGGRLIEPAWKAVERADGADLARGLMEG